MISNSKRFIISHSELATMENNITLLKKDIELIKEQIGYISDSNLKIIEQTDKFQSVINDQQDLITEHGKLVRKAVELNDITDTPILVKSLNPHTKIPIKATLGSGGFDLYSSENKTILDDGQYHHIKTGIQLQIPSNHCGKICSRSGMALNKHIVAFEGTIDSDYRNEIGVLLKNNSGLPYEIAIGDRIAQMIFVKIHSDFCLQESVSLDRSNRGGFGSTGK